jgi:hypothetical protein
MMGGTVSTDAPDLLEKQRQLAAIDARLAQHEHATRAILILFSLLAAAALAAIVNYIPHCATLVERLLGSLP